jgi:hypothetical protein
MAVIPNALHTTEPPELEQPLPATSPTVSSTWNAGVGNPPKFRITRLTVIVLASLPAPAITSVEPLRLTDVAASASAGPQSSAVSATPAAITPRIFTPPFVDQL